MALLPRKKTDRIGKGMMSWKKNAFSYVIWFLYAAMTWLALLGQGAEVCRMAGGQRYMGIAVALGCVAAAGGMAFLLRLLAVRCAGFLQEKRIHILVLGALLAAALFVVGFVLRLQGMDGAQALSSVYYEMAKVAEGQGLPQSVHGAVYFYVRLLRGVFLLLGNNPVMGLWVQVVLQFGASLLLFLVVRKLVGMTAGLVTLGFCMCAPYMVESSLELSPQMLYFFLSMAALWCMTLGHGGRKEAEDARRPSLAAGFLAGFLAAFCAYVDILGIVLLFAALGGIFCFGGQEAGRKFRAVLLCLAGAALGFGICFLMDAWFSGKLIHRVAGAWLSLYRPEGFRVPAQIIDMEFSPQISLLSAVMAFGIFSFWFDRERERISAALLSACAIMAAGCFGIFTEEMPAYFFLYLAFAVLAGIGFGQCLYVQPAKQEAVSGEGVPEDSGESCEEPPDLEILMEGIEGTAHGQEEAAQGRPQAGQTQPRFLENPLPLPKKHVKRVLDYTLPAPAEEDDYDYPVSDDDDFDI